MNIALPYSAKAIANQFLAKARDTNNPIDPMKLQKLVYYAHGWHLALCNKPLIDELVEAWPYGPVIPSLYHEFKEFGANPITRFAKDIDLQKFVLIEPFIRSDDDFVPALVNKIWEVYGIFSAIKLSELTHLPDGPWAKALAAKSPYRNIQIDNDMIANYFKAQKKAHVQSRTQAN